MARLGAHVSTQGGLDQAVRRGHSIGCDTIQLFTKSSRSWKPRPLDREEVLRFRRACKETGIHPVFAHDTYLINLASPDETLWDRSVQALEEELRRCSAMGLPYLVIHPGSATDGDLVGGIRRIADGLKIILRRVPRSRTMILLETTSGQGNSIGSRFEELATILSLARFPRRLGVCFDTCHVFSAGYELRTRKAYENTISTLDCVIGVDKVKVFHLNDSKNDCGSRIDRHEHVGKGHLGLKPFRYLLNDPRFEDRPMVLETPKGPDMQEDVENLRVLRGLVSKRKKK